MSTTWSPFEFPRTKSSSPRARIDAPPKAMSMTGKLAQRATPGDGADSDLVVFQGMRSLGCQIEPSHSTLQTPDPGCRDLTSSNSPRGIFTATFCARRGFLPLPTDYRGCVLNEGVSWSHPRRVL